MAGVISSELKKIARSPQRLLQALRPRRWRQFFSVLRFNSRSGNQWDATRNADLKRRHYSSYDEYVRHQRSKFQYLDLAEYDVNYRRQLRERLQNVPLPKSATVLCLGARQGTEVKAFLDLGCFAVGIDLNPGPENKYVLRGDFHEVQFPDRSVDIIFTNSFDHVFDAEKLIGEIKRLLKPNGMLIIEAIQGEKENIQPDHYASFWWRRIDDLVRLLGEHGFEVVQRIPFREPWPGEHLCFAWQAPEKS